MRNKIQSHLTPIAILIVFGFSCASSKTITVAFANIGSLERKTELFLDSLPIGYVKTFKTDKEVDTIFLIVRLSKGIHIPAESQFYLHEHALSSPRFEVGFSKRQTFLSEKDISVGNYVPLEGMTPKALDSVRSKFFGKPILKAEGRAFIVIGLKKK
jgi:hypothetical protein